MKSGLRKWHFECFKCGYERAELESAINETDAHEQIDEQSRATGLQALRVANFNLLLRSMVEAGVQSGKLLDVGCAHGWFLDAARVNFDVFGIEPDEKVFLESQKCGKPVRFGYFPEALSDQERFNVIVFNDVFEHMPNLESTLNDCRSHLLSDGFLVLNLPNSNGIFYRLAKFFCRFGVYSFFGRLWQKDLPSPHLHYFNEGNLKLLLVRNGFDIIRTGRLPSLVLKGLYTRIGYTGKYTFPVRLFICACVALVLPLLRILPADISFVICRKKLLA